ncbi:MAG: acyltransferase, partial [Robiginitalea sp.]
VSVFFILEVLLVKPSLFEMYAQTWHGFFLGLLAFFFGFLFVYSGSTFWNTLLKWRWMYTALAIGLYLVRFFVLDLKSPGYLVAIESNCWIFGLFGWAYKYLNRPSNMLSYLSQAAYPVYIIHMVVLYTGAYFILPLEMPVALKFIFIVTFTGSVSFVLYEFVIRRIGILRPLFGVKGTFQKVQLSKVNPPA